MKRGVDRTTEFKLALIGIPLLECLILLILTMLLLFGGELFTACAPGPDDETQEPAPSGEVVVQVVVRSAPKKQWNVSLSTSGVLLYAPTKQQPVSVENLRRMDAQSVRRPDIAALMDFANGMTPILNRDEDAMTLAKLLYGEARGIDSEAEKAAIVWCVLNRVDDGRFPDTVEAVVTQRSQFDGYAPDNPIQSNLYLLSLDVLTRWKQSKLTGKATGRVLPAEYCYFYGDGKHNYFSTDLQFDPVWDWSYPDPYPAIRAERLKHYFPSDQEIKMIANVIYGVAQSPNLTERRAVAWCVLNRVTSGLFPDTVYEVIKERKQFPAYRIENRIEEENVELVRGVVAQWYAENNGAAKEEVKRLLPKNYLYFDGNGRRNFFSKVYPVRYGYVFIADRAYLKARW